MKISRSKDASDFFKSIWSDTLELKESMYMILLNKANNVQSFLRISEGSIDGTVIDMQIIFATILKTPCKGFIIAHNHPSGNLIPSQADLQINNQIRDVAKMHKVQFLDNLIITPEGYLSFADDGLL